MLTGYCPVSSVGIALDTVTPQRDVTFVMKRRTSFRTVAGCLIATIVGRCIALGETTKFYWPGCWSENSLRDHLIKDEGKHSFDPAQLKDLTFQDCLDLHDWHHWQLGMKSRTPYPDGKRVPGTDAGRGKTTKPEDEDWEQFLNKQKQETPEP